MNKAILFPTHESWVYLKKTGGPIDHLKQHEKVYWEVPWPVKHDHFPLHGYVYIVENKLILYFVNIEAIIPWDQKHYTDADLAEKVKPELWRRDWKNNVNGIKDRAVPSSKGSWKKAFVINNIMHYSAGLPITKFRSFNTGQFIKKPQRNNLWVYDDFNLMEVDALNKIGRERYIPDKAECEQAIEKLKTSSKGKIPINDVLVLLEKQFQEKGILLKDNWRLIIEESFKIWFPN